MIPPISALGLAVVFYPAILRCEIFKAFCVRKFHLYLLVAFIKENQIDFFIVNLFLPCFRL